MLNSSNLFQMELTKPTRSNRRRFILSSLLFIFFLCVLASINEARFAALLKFGRCTTPTTDTAAINSSATNLLPPPASTDIRILIGILTLPDQYNRRHFLRLIYGTQTYSGAKIDIKFVFCNLTKEDQKILIALEIMRYDDILILNCRENMNNGKTYTYFSTLPEIFNGSGGGGGSDPPYHYVMKADDDIYIRLSNLVESLKPLPRSDLYYGFVIPCSSMDPFVKYMSGMGYLISWDLVEWIRESEIPRRRLDGPEDRVFGEWINSGRRGKNRFNAKWSMYNFPEPATKCSHELWPETIAVHLLKNQEKWIRTLVYFNATANLKESKLYHIP